MSRPPHSDSVVVSGIGVVSAIGIGVPAFIEALRVGRTGIGPITSFDVSRFRSQVVGAARDFAPQDYDFTDLSGYDRHIQMALVSAREAILNAGLDLCDMPVRLGLCLGTCNGGMLAIERHYRMLAGTEPGNYDERLHFAKRYYSAATILARVFSIRGPVTSVVTACSASTNAVGMAFDMVRDGTVDIVIAGGSDAFAQSTYAGFDKLKTTSSQACAPFSEPTGLTLGEGAGFFVLEGRRHAFARNAPIFGEILGYGLSNDAYHPTSPDPTGKGQQLCMERALDSAGTTIGEIDYVNAHGTGTVANDRTETKTLQRLFEGVTPPPVSSTKSFLGHALGSAGILEMAASILMTRDGLLPPTVNYTVCRDNCGLDYVPNVPRKANVRKMMKSNFAFGGNNCCVVLSPGDQKLAGRALESLAVAITGVGVIGHSWSSMDQLADYLRHAPEFANDPVTITDFDPSKIDRRLQLRGMDRCSQFATIATKTAMTAARWSMKPGDCQDIGLILGMTDSPTASEDAYLRRINLYGPESPDLVNFPFLVVNSVVGNASRSLILRGFSSALAAGHGAGLAALEYAERAIHAGHARSILAGGADELTPRLLSDLSAIGRGARSLKTWAPTEGAVVFALQRLDLAIASGSPILGRIMATGAGMIPPGADPWQSIQIVLADILRKGEVTAEDVATIRISVESPEYIDIIDNLTAEFRCANIIAPLEPRIGQAPAHSPLLSLGLALTSDSVPSGPTFVLSLSRLGEIHAILVLG